jgi:heme/copper-type cytochrome/quinol oxidase subunit 4
MSTRVERHFDTTMAICVVVFIAVVMPLIELVWCHLVDRPYHTDRVISWIFGAFSAVFIARMWMKP